jgi:phenylpyruvate tautomerase PptA (4-oxalocrotonate tautomerase family)
MPIVDVDIVMKAGQSLAEGLAGALADELASAFAAPPGRVWVRLRRLDAEAYAENGVPPKEAPHPVFVTVLHAHPPRGRALESEMILLTSAVARVLRRERASVHVIYAPAGAGRVAFGGVRVD